MKGIERPYKQHRMLRALVVLALLATAAVIFLFSEEGGIESSATSRQAARFLMRIVGRDFDALSRASQTRLLFYVRKGAHFLEFSALGVFLHLFLGIFIRKPLLSYGLSVALGALYAATDEYHQLLVGTRGAQWRDVALDSAGVLFGAAIALLFLRIWRSKHPLPPRKPRK